MINKLLDAAVESAIDSGADDDVTNTALLAVTYILQLNLKNIDLTVAFDKALHAADRKTGTEILKQMRRQHPDVMSPKPEFMIGLFLRQDRFVW